MKLKKCFHAKTTVEEDFGIIVVIVINTSLFPLVAIQDYALAVARDILINGLQCWLIS